MKLLLAGNQPCDSLRGSAVYNLRIMNSYPAARVQHSARSVLDRRAGTNLAFKFLLSWYAIARLLQVYPGRTPMLVVEWGGILIFVAIALTVGSLFEDLGIRTGFPFGYYHFTDLMGPALGGIPVMLALAYVGMAYLSWTVARIILGVVAVPLSGSRQLVAASAMVAWDVSQGLIWSTVLHAWVWARGGAYFGVPLSNFFGWFLTTYLIFQLFAVYSQRWPTSSVPFPAAYWTEALLFYGLSAAGNLLLVRPQSRFSMVTDATGAQWRVSTITETCAIITLFTMGTLTMLAWLRLRANAAAGTLCSRPCE
jgi:uncharacterized membrane protein